jgi:hypothetical protein
MFETFHNICLQQYGKSVECFFVAILNNYVRAFRQNASYKVYLNGGKCREGLAKDELRLRQASQFGEPLQMANTIAKYTNGSSFTTKIPHLDGQEVFGSTKWRANITPRLEGDSHMHDHVNFSQLKVNTMSSGFAGSNVDVGESSGIVRNDALF